MYAKQKKNRPPKGSVLVRQKGLVCVFAREWAKTDVRLRQAVAGGAHSRRILMFESPGNSKTPGILRFRELVRQKGLEPLTY